MRKFTFVVITLTFLLLTSRAEAESPGLRGMEDFSLETIVVEDKDSKRVGLSKPEVDTELSKLLRDSGFQLAVDPSQYPRLEVTISVIKPFAGFVVSYRFRMRDWVVAGNNEKLRYTATIWEKSGLFSTTKKDLHTKLTQALRKTTAALVTEHGEENPR